MTIRKFILVRHQQPLLWHPRNMVTPGLWNSCSNTVYLVVAARLAPTLSFASGAVLRDPRSFSRCPKPNRCAIVATWNAVAVCCTRGSSADKVMEILARRCRNTAAFARARSSISLWCQGAQTCAAETVRWMFGDQSASGKRSVSDWGQPWWQVSDHFMKFHWRWHLIFQLLKRLKKISSACLKRKSWHLSQSET